MPCDERAIRFARPRLRRDDHDRRASRPPLPCRRIRSTRQSIPKRSKQASPFPPPQAEPARPGPARSHTARAPRDTGPDVPSAKGGGSASFRVRPQPLEQLPPLHHDMRRPVSPGRLESIGEPPVGQRLEATQRERGAVDITPARAPRPRSREEEGPRSLRGYATAQRRRRRARGCGSGA